MTPSTTTLPLWQLLLKLGSQQKHASYATFHQRVLLVGFQHYFLEPNSSVTTSRNQLKIDLEQQRNDQTGTIYL